MVLCLYVLAEERRLLGNLEVSPRGEGWTVGLGHTSAHLHHSCRLMHYVSIQNQQAHCRRTDLIYLMFLLHLRATLSGRRFITSALSSTFLSIQTAARKRTFLTLNVEHQRVPPVGLNLVVEMELWLWIILAALLLECKGEDRVIQPTEDVFASEGDTVTLDCKFETTYTTPSLFWYRQEMGDFPKYLWKSYAGLSQNALGISEDRFNATINGKSVPLKIQKLQLTDSAVYYCALQPTVTGNTTTLYKNLWREDNTILHNIH
ncbi:uncharacterized protein LOC132979601 [Labrus mixtus]|uniref:uncharacterized protein LOC132979601 n=1 Tax=Labrus mixtus TaxID=508554 RepID=UPI0029C0796B|nr:uncharacterized protein LOC132979601 [Labrus mixtus]